jgi:hypothetical protein
MGWFATSFTTILFNCNNHLQLIHNSLQFSIFLQAWMLLNMLHEFQQMQLNVCENIHIQLVQLKYNYCVTIMQLVCNYHGNVMLTSFFINPSKYDTWHYGDFLVCFFEILISTIDHNHSFINGISVPFAIMLQL